MNRSLTDLPERLLDEGATDFERRILTAGTRKGPPPEVLAHMAQRIGVSATAVGVAVAAKELTTGAAVAKSTSGAGAVAGSTNLLPWMSVGALVIVVAGAVVGTRLWKSAPVESPKAPVAMTAPRATVPSPKPSPTSEAVMAAPPGEDTLSNLGDTPSVSDLPDQIAMIDLARSAVNTGDGRRALEFVRRYQDKYPKGQFLPESAALKIEALVRLGRIAEARVLAERFVAKNKGTMLAERVAALASLPRP